jgi:hypothetical protein
MDGNARKWFHAAGASRAVGAMEERSMCGEHSFATERSPLCSDNGPCQVHSITSRLAPGLRMDSEGECLWGPTAGGIQLPLRA